MFGAAALARRAAPASLSRHIASSSRLHPPLSPAAQQLALLPPSLLSPPLARSAASEGDASMPGSSKREQQLGRQEYLDRLTRCKNLLSTTLPEFLRLGVVDYDLGAAAEFFPGDKQRPAYFSEMRFAFLTPPPRVSNRELRRQAHAAANRRKPTPEEEDAAFAMPHFALHGRTLYMASAQLLRLTLLALFANPSLVLERIYLVDHSSNRPTNANSTALSSNQRHAYIVRMRFEGTLRVLGTHETFRIRSKYKISLNGDICVHQIERVEPELGGKLWAGLRATFLRLAGFARRSDPHPVPACMGRSPRRSALSAVPPPSSRGWHSSAALRDSRQQLGAIDRRLSLSFTCTAGEVPCGHRSAHEFSAKSYEKGIVIVQCPKCKSRHLIADHLGWFKDSDEARTVEGIVAAHGGRVRRGSLRDNGETLEIESDEGEGEGAGIGERVPDAQPGADDDKWWKKPK